MIRTQANSYSSHTNQLQGSKENWDGMKGTVAPSGSLPALLPPEGYEETGWCLRSAGHQIKDLYVLCPASGHGLFSLGALVVVVVVAGLLRRRGPQSGCISA